MKPLLKAYLLLLLIIGFFGCSKEDDHINEPIPNNKITTVDFEVEQQSVVKSSVPINLKLNFDHAASVNSSFTIRLTGSAVHQVNYTTDPEAQNGIIKSL